MQNENTGPLFRKQEQSSSFLLQSLSRPVMLCCVCYLMSAPSGTGIPTGWVQTLRAPALWLGLEGGDRAPIGPPASVPRPCGSEGSSSPRQGQELVTQNTTQGGEEAVGGRTACEWRFQTPAQVPLAQWLHLQTTSARIKLLRISSWLPQSLKRGLGGGVVGGRRGPFLSVEPCSTIPVTYLSRLSESSQC